MYQIKYLLGIFSGIFGLVYLFFGIVGWEYARDPWDKYTSFVFFFIHGIVAAALLSSSLRDKNREETRLNNVIDSMMLVHPSVTAELLAQEANMSIPDAHDYIEKLAKTKRLNTDVPH
jgi:hypothetical protein